VWSGNITLQMLATYVADLDVMLETLPALKLYMAALAISLAIIIYAYHLIFKRFYDEQHSGRLPELRFFTYYLLAVAAFSFLIHISFDREDPGIWSGEPFSNLFLSYIPMFEYDPSLINMQATTSINKDGLEENAQGEHKNIIFIMVDALRADHLKPYNYHRDTTPFLSNLYNKGKLIKVEMAHSTCSESACGILSTLTGLEFDSIKSNSAHLGDILREHGYKSSFIVTGDHDWGGLNTIYRADHLSDGKSREQFSANDDAGIINDLKGLSLSSTQPNFVYIHLYSAHELGLRHRQFNSFTPHQPPFNPLANLFSNKEDKHQREINNYDNGIVQTDYFIAQIFSQLEQKNLLEKSIVYITSDHGQAFHEHGHYGHTRYLYEEHIRIPLLIYDQERARYQNQDYAIHIDIAPTILDSLSLTPPLEWNGHSLLEVTATNRVSHHQTTNKHGWKLNLFKRGRAIYKHLWEGESYKNRTQEMLFEITSDPEEQTNLLENNTDQGIIEEILTMLKNPGRTSGPHISPSQ
jgi:glucan phosphoethanolaminetransferase (alkaline phosphatase superfamily)